MSYNITLSNGNILTSVPDSQLVNTFGGISLIGKKYPGFGTSLNNNLVRITENFANSTPPSNPFIGQFWFDNVANTVKFWNGTTFKPISVITSSDSAPLNPIEGDEWFDTIHQQLFVWNSTLAQWILIGPPGSEGTGKEGFVIVTDAANSNIVYLEWYANDTLIAIVSSDSIINPGIAGFGNIRPGINFVTTPTHGIVDSGIYNIDELTIGDADQIHLFNDSNYNTVLATDGGNVLYATNGNNLVSGELANITGTVYVNNLVVANSLSSHVPGSNNQILFNLNGFTAATSSLILDSSGINVIVPNTLSAENIEVYNEIDVSGNVNAGAANIAGPLQVTNSAAIKGSLFVTNNCVIEGSTSLGGVITGAENSSYVQIQPGATSANALVVQDYNGTHNLLTIDVAGITTAHNTLNVAGTLNANNAVNIKGITTFNVDGSSFTLPINHGAVPGAALLTNALGTTSWGNVDLTPFFNNSITTNGYQYLPGGLIIQWMTGITDLSKSGRGPFTENWPIQFPNNCFNIQPSVIFDSYVSGTNQQGTAVYVNGPGNYTSTINLYYDHRGDGDADANFKVLLFGIGN